MALGEAMHQKSGKPQGGSGRTGARRGEAALEAVSDEATLARHAQTDCGADDLLGQALARENMARAWKRVKANKGSAGVDGRTVQETGEPLKTAWPDIRRSLLDGSYRPDPVRRVGIPKPGGGERELGIPTVVDRLIQQALLQVLQPRIDPTFSEHSHGLPAGAKRAWGGVGGTAVRASRLQGGGGRGPGEVLRPRQPRHPDGPAGQADRGQAGAAVDTPLPASRHPGARSTQRAVRGHAARRTTEPLAGQRAVGRSGS